MEGCLLKLKKMIVIVLSTIISIVGIAGITASANTISSDYVTISYDENHVNVTSKSSVARYTVVSTLKGNDTKYNTILSSDTKKSVQLLKIQLYTFMRIPIIKVKKSL